jgi:hypothetical protein
MNGRKYLNEPNVPRGAKTLLKKSYGSLNWLLASADFRESLEFFV